MNFRRTEKLTNLQLDKTLFLKILMDKQFVLLYNRRLSLDVYTYTTHNNCDIFLFFLLNSSYNEFIILKHRSTKNWLQS